MPTPEEILAKGQEQLKKDQDKLAAAQGEIKKAHEKLKVDRDKLKTDLETLKAEQKELKGAQDKLADKLLELKDDRKKLEDYLEHLAALEKVEQPGKGNAGLTEAQEQLLDDACKAYGIAKRFVLSAAIDPVSGAAVIVTHGGSKVSYLAGDKVESLPTKAVTGIPDIKRKRK